MFCWSDCFLRGFGLFGLVGVIFGFGADCGVVCVVCLFSVVGYGLCGLIWCLFCLFLFPGHSFVWVGII